MTWKKDMKKDTKICMYSALTLSLANGNDYIYIALRAWHGHCCDHGSLCSSDPDRNRPQARYGPSLVPVCHGSDQCHIWGQVAFGVSGW